MIYAIRFKSLPFVTLLLCLASFNSLADSAHQILDKMSHGMREVNYDGVFVYQHDDTMHSFRIVHSVVDGKERERLVYLDGEPREIIRHDHKVTCIHPGEALMRLDHGVTLTHVSENLVKNLMDVDESYDINLEDNSRIAGHDVAVLSVTSESGDRYNYRLMVDKEHGVLLGSEVIGLNGEILETFRFTSVTINKPIEPSSLEPQITKPTISHSHDSNKIRDGQKNLKKTEAKWQLGFVPKGFLPVSSLPKADVTEGYESQGYTDGLTTFTVFVESIPEKQQQAYHQRGATVMYSANKVFNAHILLITVVGEIPLAMARHITENIEFVGENHDN